MEDFHLWQYGYQDILDHSPTENNKKILAKLETKIMS